MYSLRNHHTTTLFTRGRTGCICWHTVIPESVTNFNTSFADCQRLEEVSLPTCVTEYGKNMFANCVNLRKIHTASKITAYRSGCLKGCSAECPTTMKIYVPKASVSAYKQAIPSFSAQIVGIE